MDLSYYIFDTTIYSSTGFTTNDETREWLLTRDNLIPRLAKYRLYYDELYMPPPLPVISIIAQPTMNMQECMPNGILSDYLLPVRMVMF